MRKQAYDEPVLADFLGDVFERLSPVRIALHVVSGRGCSKMGPIVKEIRPNGVAEDAVRLGEDLYRTAQHDCCAVGYAQKYAVFAFNQLDACVGRFVLSMRPRS